MLFWRFRNPWGDAAEAVEEPVGLSEPVRA